MPQVDLVTPEQTFTEAFSRWIGNRTIANGLTHTRNSYISPRTEADYRQYARTLEKMFGALPLRDLHIGHLREYHRARSLNDGPWTHPAGANLVRKEVGMLVRIMKSAGAWTEELERFYEPLSVVESDVQRAMTQEQQQNFLDVAASREEWNFIYNYTIAALQTTASTNEMRALRLGDIYLDQCTIQIRREGSKNKYRLRTIPLETREVCWAFERLIARAHYLGAGAPFHYLFPFGVARNLYDPSRPMSDSGLKKRWDEVRRAAGLPWLRPYDLRHTAITRMAEAGTPIAVIMAFAGHMTLKMQQHYTQIGMMAMKKAVASTWHDNALNRTFAPRTNSGTGYPQKSANGY